MKHSFLILSISSVLFVGCGNVPQLPQPYVPDGKSNFVSPDGNLSMPMDESNVTEEPQPIVQHTIPKPPKKEIKLKEVHDDDFTPEYMYPKTETKKVVETQPVVTQEVVSSSTMSETECISMIGQDRFDKYIQMLGSKSSAIKRCQMIKASQG